MPHLLPVPPLDGSSILSGLSFRAYQLYRSPQAAMYGMFILLAIFFVTPVGQFFWLGCRVTALLYAEVLSVGLGAPPVYDVVG